MFEPVVDVLRFLLDNPIIAVVIISVVVISNWLQVHFLAHFLHRAAEKNAEAKRAGWTTPAGRSERRHDTGIGTQAILVMRRPHRYIYIAVWTLILFGGCAAYYWQVVLAEPSEQTTKNWLIFVISLVFSTLAVALFAAACTSVHVSVDDIVLRRLFRRPERFSLKEISSVEAVGKDPATGVRLILFDGRSVKLLAGFEGYSQVLKKIHNAHPDLLRLLTIGRIADAVAARRTRHLSK